MSTKSRTGPRPNADGWKYDRKLPLLHRIFTLFNILPPNQEEAFKADPKSRMPAFSEWNQLAFPLPLAFVPFLARYYYYHNVSHEMPSSMVTWLFLFAYIVFVGLLSIQQYNGFVRKYGYLDANSGRDTVPYELMPKVAFEIFAASSLRTLVIVLGCYDPKEPPSLSFWLPLQLFMLTLTEDFTYYWLHRLCHEAESCWHIHRLHHTTKHPTTMLLGYADDFQEFIDLVGSPMISWTMCPLGFDATVVWLFMLNYVQLGGHCGARLHLGSILTGPYLRPFGLELVVEDHDLHHRHGWKDAYNYGKQTRFWDSLYGTAGDRVEGFDQNLDWSMSLRP
ncbi:hypothetical protein MVES1_000789 [Malassezia vespertilionis]|uniref:uncharacterized protein n=1 Tax=Malassezia vespertilionis TaxID=2020962 RepID=UPI0024B15722|nr:uncharacterized protein MVES1_000789 [Malassezia vespertilionis]WFD05459.1 hypothetical protein MVES1_000789 [Malassezia vespertilionis]